MGKETGAKVQLQTITLKYPGLRPWEMWLSEAQERMVLAVAPEHVPALKEICETYWVELSDVGEFGVAGGKLKVVHGEMPVVDLEMGFLHACPRLEATTDEKESLAYFGPAYAAYMQRTKRFIPFLL